MYIHKKLNYPWSAPLRTKYSGSFDRTQLRELITDENRVLEPIEVYTTDRKTRYTHIC